MAGPKLCVLAFALAACVSGGLSTCTQSSCPRDETCCTLPEGGEGCCPYKNAICCLDGIHCCPFGTVCDEEHRRCVSVLEKGGRESALLELIAAPNISVSSNEHCPDGSTCPDVSTCCMTTTKHYGCCPFQQGVCCRDLTHCCPYGTHCIGGGLCRRQQTENDIEGAEAPHTNQAVIETTARRGGVSACTDTTCPQDQTCCELSGGGEGCCPYPDAICCLDGLHCCPFGTVCDEEHGRCIDVLQEKKERVVFVELTPATTTNISESNEHCPDGSTCPGVTTCCMMPTKHYGCCPYQHGVCCRDMTHCCPYGTHCIGAGLCRRQESESTLEAARVQEKEQVVVAEGCSGRQQRCGSDQTCCVKRDGSAGCCPMKNAVCCHGIDSCCPQGFVCSIFGCLKV
ncbi:progranulin-like [Schistocerca gregaria]|uniref:progranulin-like n=1 Tax=Schistocerca gregaria TaxID=7010 RepID=UPI00211DAC06|nr:progranulin-like [Schistocerca gregaria]